jgi:hypothetical protein
LENLRGERMGKFARMTTGNESIATFATLVKGMRQGKKTTLSL